MSSMSKMHKANTNARKAQGKAPLSFAEYAEFCDRAAVARAARNAPKVRKAFKAAKFPGESKPQGEYVRIEKRVDCFGVNRKGITTIGADLADSAEVARICGGKVVSWYTSKRGDRGRIQTARKVNVAKLSLAGFTPKGF